MPIIAPIPRSERCLMHKTIHNTHDKNRARRLIAMLMSHRGERVSVVARAPCCARSYVELWINWFTLYSFDRLESLPAGRRRRWLFEQIYNLLKRLVARSPGDFGYQRSHRSTEFLVVKSTR